jgi:hypothetical protein
MRPNLQVSLFDLKVRHRGSQPSIFVRSFRLFTTCHCPECAAKNAHLALLRLRPLSDILLPDRRELLADYSLVQVMLNDQHPKNAVVMHFQTSDHFRGREEHADVTAEMLLSRTSYA